MTIEQFHREFKVFFDKTDSSSYPEFLPGEIDIYLNEGQDRIIKQRYGRDNIYNRGFEEMQKRTDDLKELVVTKFTSLSQATPYQDVGDNVYRADLADLYENVDLTTSSTEEYMFYLKSIVQTCDGSCCSWSRVKLVQHDDIASVITDPFNKPTKGRPIIFFEDGDIFIWTAPGKTINGFQVTFLKRAAQLNLGGYSATPRTDCELNEHMHKELLQVAITIALENLASPRVQSQIPVNENKVE
jgi:hypothetical protein